MGAMSLSHYWATHVEGGPSLYFPEDTLTSDYTTALSLPLARQTRGFSSKGMLRKLYCNCIVSPLEHPQLSKLTHSKCAENIANYWWCSTILMVLTFKELYFKILLTDLDCTFLKDNRQACTLIVSHTKYRYTPPVTKYVHIYNYQIFFLLILSSLYLTFLI